MGSARPSTHPPTLLAHCRPPQLSPSPTCQQLPDLGEGPGWGVRWGCSSVRLGVLAPGPLVMGARRGLNCKVTCHLAASASRGPRGYPGHRPPLVSSGRNGWPASPPQLGVQVGSVSCSSPHRAARRCSAGLKDGVGGVGTRGSLGPASRLCGQVRQEPGQGGPLHHPSAVFLFRSPSLDPVPHFCTGTSNKTAAVRRVPRNLQ